MKEGQFIFMNTTTEDRFYSDLVKRINMDDFIVSEARFIKNTDNTYNTTFILDVYNDKNKLIYNAEINIPKVDVTNFKMIPRNVRSKK